MSVDVKICGNRTREDLQLIASAGADYAGMILDVPQSPRSITLEEATHLREDCPLPLVLVVLDASARHIQAACDALAPFAVQLHGGEPTTLVRQLKESLPCQVWKVVHPRPGRQRPGDARTLTERIAAHAMAGADVILLDTAASPDLRGGTGMTSDWEAAGRLVQRASVPVFLAGGLRPDNVADAITTAQPAGVDVASGVESCPGTKSPEAVRAFVAAAKASASR